MAIEGLLGRKVGMTQMFRRDGTVEPVTVVQAGPCVVAQVKSTEHDGYAAVQLAYGETRPRDVTKPAQGHFDRHGGSEPDASPKPRSADRPRGR